jgi:hypothetical protein
MGVQLIRGREHDEPVEGGFGGERQARDPPGSEAASARRGGLALEEELRGRKRRIPFGRKNERDPPFEGLGSGVGIGKGEKQTLDEPLHGKLIGVIGCRGRGSALSFSPKEETSGLGKPVPVYDDHEGGSENPLDGRGHSLGETTNSQG